MAADIVSRADTGFENLWGLQDCAETIYEFASEEQKQKYIPRVCAGETMSMDLTEPDAGSDLQSVMLKATRTARRHMASQRRETLHHQRRQRHPLGSRPL